MTEPEITTVSPKGQVVIPQSIRKRLRLAPRTKLLVYGEGDTVIMRRIRLPDIRDEWARICQIIEERNRKFGPLTEEDVKREVEAQRGKRRQ